MIIFRNSTGWMILIFIGMAVAMVSLGMEAAFVLVYRPLRLILLLACFLLALRKVEKTCRLQASPVGRLFGSTANAVGSLMRNVTVVVFVMCVVKQFINDCSSGDFFDLLGALFIGMVQLCLFFVALMVDLGIEYLIEDCIEERRSVWGTGIMSLLLSAPYAAFVLYQLSVTYCRVFFQVISSYLEVLPFL